MALAVGSNAAPVGDGDLMDIDIDMDLGDHDVGIDDEFQLEVRAHLTEI